MNIEMYAWMALVKTAPWTDTQTLTVVPVRYRPGRAATVPWSWANPGAPRKNNLRRKRGKPRSDYRQHVL